MRESNYPHPRKNLSPSPKESYRDPERIFPHKKYYYKIYLITNTWNKVIHRKKGIIVKLTFKQVVEKIGANSSTLAFQRDKFAEFIPCENEGRHRRYNQESVDVLTITSSMYAAGKSYEEIKDALESRYGVPTDIIVKDNNSPTTQQVEFMDAIREVFQQELSKRDNLILNLQQELADIKEALATIHQTSESRAINSENRDRDIMQTIRVLQDEKGKQKQSLWRKIFKT